MSEQDDQRRVRRAAVSIGLAVAVASALIIAGGVGVLLAVILLNRRPEGSEHIGGFPHREEGDDFVIDADRLLPVVIVLGVIGVLLLALVAWFAARRSVRPLADALRLQRNFVADASHELRTPLTALTSRIQLLQRRHDRGEPVEQTLTELRTDAAMMNDVLSDLLLAAEGGAVAAVPASVDDAVAAAVRSVEPLAAEAEVGVRVEADGSAEVALPSVTLVRLLVALLDNAVQHSPSGSDVIVRTGREGALASIRVIDHGSGIHGIAPEDVFERFARSNETGRRRSFGIGLSLVRDVAVRAGGSVEVESASDAGTTFVLRLPAV